MNAYDMLNQLQQVVANLLLKLYVAVLTLNIQVAEIMSSVLQ